MPKFYSLAIPPAARSLHAQMLFSDLRRPLPAGQALSSTQRNVFGLLLPDLVDHVCLFGLGVSSFSKLPGIAGFAAQCG